MMEKKVYSGEAVIKNEPLYASEDFASPSGCTLTIQEAKKSKSFLW